MKKFLIAPSILSADFSRLGQDVKKSLISGGDLIHFDVMDNHYVPNLTIGPLVLESLRKYGINNFIDVHLMTIPVDDLIIKFLKVGASCITFHPETSKNIHKSINLIKKYECKVGLAFNINTSLNYLNIDIISKIDLILLMGVKPGFPGQNLIPEVFNKIIAARKIIDKNNSKVLLGIDGGVKIENIFKIASFGVNLFVIGSAIFNSINYKVIIDKMRKKLLKIK